MIWWTVELRTLNPDCTGKLLTAYPLSSSHQIPHKFSFPDSTSYIRSHHSITSTNTSFLTNMFLYDWIPRPNLPFHIVQSTFVDPRPNYQ